MAAYYALVFVMVVFFLASCDSAPNSHGVIKIPDECQKKPGLCTVKPPGYDLLEDKINRHLPASLDEQYQDRASNLVSTFVDHDSSNCPNKTMIKELYFDTNNPNEVVAQTKRLYQRLEFVECAKDAITRQARSPTLQCFKDIDNLHMSATCEQYYTNIYLYVYNIKEDALVYKPFPIPTCCSCRLSSP